MLVPLRCYVLFFCLYLCDQARERDGVRRETWGWSGGVAHSHIRQNRSVVQTILLSDLKLIKTAFKLQAINELLKFTHMHAMNLLYNV